MQLFVKLPSLGTQVLNVYTYNTIKDIKNMLGLVGFNLYTDKLLEDQHTIEHYGIVSNTTIYALGRLEGGIPVVNPASDPGILGQFANSIISTVTNVSEKIRQTARDVNAAVQRKVEFIWDKIKFAKELLTAAQFFPIVTLVLIVLAFFGKPLEIIMLILGLIIVGFLYVIYSILNLPPFIYIIALSYFMIFEVIPFIVYCIIFTCILALVFIICIIVTGINIMTGGALKNIVLCDNSPGAWYQTPNYHLGNNWKRGMLCSRPCRIGYAPDETGSNCLPTPKGSPPYCPQAEIMRIYATSKADSHYMYRKFSENKNINYLASPPEKREKMLADYYIQKTKFAETCRKQMAEYDPISLNICASANTLGLPPNELAKLKQVCAQAYCTPSKNYPFCSKISSMNDDDDDAFLKQLMKTLIIILTFIIIIIFVFKVVYSSQKFQLD
jgi:hypothetical protein